MEGYNGTIFAYGQTGSGKTYSMEVPLLTPSSQLFPRAQIWMTKIKWA
jgi:hypothetical protein